MYDYTFAMLTYNQEKFVIEHLESLRYQIEKFGQKYHIFFLLCDDCSTDKTVMFVKNWIAQNSYLFMECQYIISEKNRGIVRNYVQCLQNIKTDNFKILAGDDLYYKNNIFEITRNRDFVLSPLIHIPSINIEEKFFWTYKYAVIRKKNLRRDFEEFIKYIHVIQTPGVFWKHKYFDKKMVEMLKGYKWIEDTPTWNYLLSNDSLNVYFEEKPLIMYRESAGISTNENHALYSEFRKEQIKIKEQIFVNNKKVRILNPYRYKYFCMRIIYERWMPYFSKKYRNYAKYLNIEKREASIYYNKIKSNASNWLSGFVESESITH